MSGRIVNKNDVISYLRSRTEVITETGCWIWMLHLSRDGYAHGGPEGRKIVQIHRWAYIKINGDIGNLTIDHLCRVRCCVNPAHLEPVTMKENILRGNCQSAINKRKEKCKNGHSFDKAYKRKDGSEMRICRACNREAVKRYQVRRSQK
jgi:hypothetical protein